MLEEIAIKYVMIGKLHKSIDVKQDRKGFHINTIHLCNHNKLSFNNRNQRAIPMHVSKMVEVYSVLIIQIQDLQHHFTDLFLNKRIKKS